MELVQASLRSGERYLLVPPIEAMFGTHPVFICDLSRRGARLRHSAPIEVGHSWRLHFRAGETDEEIEATVVWTRADEHEAGPAWSTGLRLDSADGRVDRILDDLRAERRCSRIEDLRAVERFVIDPPLAGEMRLPDGTTVPLTIDDLSVRGARVLSSRPLPAGESAVFAFSVAGQSLQVAVRVSIAWSAIRDVPAGDEGIVYQAGVAIPERPESLRLALGHLVETGQAKLESQSLDLKVRILLARARERAADVRLIEASGVAAEEFFLVSSARDAMRINRDEAAVWQRRAAQALADPVLAPALVTVADQPDAVAIWEYLDRSLAADVIGRVLDVLPQNDDSRVTIQAAQEEIFRLRTLVEASKLINSSIETDSLFGSILGVAQRELGVERGTLYFVDEKKGEIWSKIASGLNTNEIRLPIGRGLAGSVAANGETILLHDAYSDPRFDRTSDFRSGFHTRSVLCVPIKNREEKIVGVLQLLNKRDGDFGPKDIEFLESLSDHMAIAMENANLHRSEVLKNRMERELQLGREIQSALLPTPPVDVYKTEIAADSRACYEVGGDYYDFIELPGGEVGFVIGDVSGKGVAAALIMSSVQAALRVAAPIEPDLPRLIGRLNALLYRSTRGRKYVTFFFGRYNPYTGTLRFVNAGHNPPFLHHDGAITRLGSTGKPIGLLPDVPFSEATAQIEPGDVLFLYTDGMNEAANLEDDEFGMERWQALCHSKAGLAVAEIPAALLDGIAEFENGAPATDDKTVVVFRRGA